MGRPPPLRDIIRCRDPGRPSVLWKLNTRQQRSNNHSFIQQCILRPVRRKASGYTQSTWLWINQRVSLPEIYHRRWETGHKKKHLCKLRILKFYVGNKVGAFIENTEGAKEGEELFWFLVDTLKGRVIGVETWQMKRDKVCKQHVKSILNRQWTLAKARSREATGCAFWEEGGRLMLEIQQGNRSSISAWVMMRSPQF